MMRKNSIALFVILAVCISIAVPSYAAKPTTAAACKQCHQPADNVVRGNLFGISEKFKTVQVSVGSLIWVIKYGDDLKLAGAVNLTVIPKEKEIAVTFTGSEKTPYAIKLSVKTPPKIAPEKLVSLEAIAGLVEAGPEKGKYVLIDSRPAPRYNEGHLPHAVNLPHDKFDSMKDKILPKEKSTLLVFYCGGMTCRLSPESAKKAEDLGYTNTRIFQAGMPEWKKAEKTVITEPAALINLIEKDMAYVLIDLRPADEATKGYIQGAVSVPEKDLTGAKAKFPADLSAPVILYGSGAEDAFRTVRGWGYKDTTVLPGGLEGWKQAGGLIKTGSLETTISYLPKPRPGEIEIEEFKALAEKGAVDKIILDVRDPDEVINGMIRGAINIPAGKITERVAEIPKDKEIITHCTTGIRAEMAYEDLKELGFRVRFLNAVIQIDKDGKYEITKK
ncbi:MAG: rhodanese-like domain-containing protein [Thermodesulfovibrionales bacterium]